jgi:hypothetical protein
MRAVLVVLTLPPKTPQPVANRFVQKLYGQASTTRGGSYRYRKIGLLDGIPHRKLRPGVLIVRERDLPGLVEFLRQWRAEFEVRRITPNPEDLGALSPARS